MIRVTTNGALRSYKSHLMNATKKMNDSYTSVMTGRRFNTYAEDPASATRAFRMRSSLASASQQSENNDTITKKFTTAWSVIDEVQTNIVDKMGRIPALTGNSDTNMSVLSELGQVLKSGAESLVHSMNAKYGDDFMFGGAEIHEVPFTWGEDGELLYRGEKVDGMNTSDYQRIDDHLYTDIGLGFKEDINGSLIPSSAYDGSLNGLDFTGYGTETVTLSDGTSVDVPQNVASVMMELGKVFQGYDLEKHEWTYPENGGSREYAVALIQRLEEASSEMIKAHANLDAEVTYLNANAERLTWTMDNLNEQIVDTEDVDSAEAIMELTWAQQCYNAALKIGTSIIPESLMDYMR